MDPSRARYWMTRLYLAVNVLFIALIGIFDPASLAHHVIRASGTEGVWAMYLLAGIAALALADCLVNDMLPPQFVMGGSFKRRHLIYMAMAIGLVGVSYVTAKHTGPTSAHLFFLMQAGFATFVAFFDLYARHSNK